MQTMRCELCGNEYDKAFRITMPSGEEHTFDSFECAIAVCAPRCAHCDCRIIGHGVEAGDTFYCCAHCAASSGVSGVADRVEAGSRA